MTAHSPTRAENMRRRELHAWAQRSTTLAAYLFVSAGSIAAALILREEIWRYALAALLVAITVGCITSVAVCIARGTDSPHRSRALRAE